MRTAVAFRVMLRRSLTLFLRELASALALAALLLAVCAGGAYALIAGERETFTPISVAVVEEEGSIAGRLMIRLIAADDSIDSLLDVKLTSEKKAQAGLADGSYTALVRLPEGYYDDISVGSVSSGEIILSEANPVFSQLILLLSDVGTELIATGQYGIFAGQQVLWAENCDSAQMADYLTRINARYLSETLTADGGYFAKETTAYAGTSLSLASHYILVFFALFAVLSPLFFTATASADCGSGLLSRLRACGVSLPAFYAGRLLFPFLFLLTVSCGALTAIDALFGVELTPASAVGLLAAALTAAVSGVCVLTFSGGGRAGILTITALSLAGMLLMGGIVPFSMLPSALTAVGRFTPLGTVYSLLSPFFGGRLRLAPLLAAAAYCALGLLLARRRLRGALVRRAGEL